MSTFLGYREEEEMDTGCGEHRTQCLTGVADVDCMQHDFFTLAALSSTDASCMNGTLEGMPPYHGGSDGIIHAFLIHGLGSEEKGWERDALGAGKRVGLSWFCSTLFFISSRQNCIGHYVHSRYLWSERTKGRREGREGRKRKEREEGKKPLDRLCGPCLASSSGL